MPRITVYTATYNRAYTLGKGYEALLRQTYKDFEWLIVDDGSTDETRSLINSWITENRIPIRYIYQENQGVNAARNRAIENIDSELNILVDSDDYLTDSALEDIIRLWDRHQGEGYVGVIAMDQFPDGSLIGREIPTSLNETTLSALYDELGISGDKKMAYLTSVCKKYPTPVIPGEKYYPNKQKYYQIDREGNCLVLHKAICVAEYLPDGITASRYKRYMKNPNGFMQYRRFLMEYIPTFSNICRQMIHYNAMRLFVQPRPPIRGSGHALVGWLLLPLGFAWSLYIRQKAKR